MAWLEIPNNPVKTLFDRKYKVPERDDGGAVVWQDTAKKEAKFQEATTYSLITEVLILFTQLEALRSIQKPLDGSQAIRLWNQIDRDRETTRLRVKPDQYKWLHGLLARKVPTTKEAKDAGFQERSIKDVLFRLDSWMLSEQLKSLDECKLDAELVPSKTVLTVPNVLIQTIFHKAAMVPIRNEDGDVVWEDAKKTVQSNRPAKTVDLILELLLSLMGDEKLVPMQEEKDARLATRLWRQVVPDRDHETLTICSEEYDWLHKVLARKIPLFKADTEAGLESRTIASYLYGVNDWLFQEDLKPVDQRRTDSDEPE